jgi:hypothetical protein
MQINSVFRLETQSKSPKDVPVWDFWSQAFWVRDTQSVLLTHTVTQVFMFEQFLIFLQ